MTPERADLELALRAVRAAGVVVMQWFGRELEVRHKSPGQPLTEADLAADRSLRNDLTGARPEYGWLSEESAGSPDRLARRRVWIVDPIDGTRSFIARRPEFTISVGLVEDGVPVVGVVLNPATTELFHAVRDGGAYLSVRGGPPERLRVAANGLGDQMTMLASRTEIAAGEFDPFHGGWRIHPAGSTAYKLARIAAGRGDAFLSRGPKSEWDVCAGVLLVEEAGGRVTDLHGARVGFNGPDPYVHGILATGGALHDALVEKIGTLPLPARLRRPEWRR